MVEKTSFEVGKTYKGWRISNNKEIRCRCVGFEDKDPIFKINNHNPVVSKVTEDFDDHQTSLVFYSKKKIGAHITSEEVV